MSLSCGERLANLPNPAFFWLTSTSDHQPQPSPELRATGAFTDEETSHIFALRGCTREQVIEALSIRRAAATDTTSSDDEVLISPEVAPSLEDQIDAF